MNVVVGQNGQILPDELESLKFWQRVSGGDGNCREHIGKANVSLPAVGANCERLQVLARGDDAQINSGWSKYATFDTGSVGHEVPVGRTQTAVGSSPSN